MPQDLSEALKEATKDVHVQAENSEFMRNFQKGLLTPEGLKVCGLAGSTLVDSTTGMLKAQTSGLAGEPRDQMACSRKSFY
jgi:hypothetical protein